MKIESLHIGMRVKHPQYGTGTVKTIAEHTAEIRFDDGLKTIAPDTSGLQAAEPQMAVFVAETVRAVVQELGIEKPESLAEELAGRWHRGRLVMHSSDPALQPKEVPLDVFFHKIVMIR